MCPSDRISPWCLLQIIMFTPVSKRVCHFGGGRDTTAIASVRGNRLLIRVKGWASYGLWRRTLRMCGVLWYNIHFVPVSTRVRRRLVIRFGLVIPFWNGYG